MAGRAAGGAGRRRRLRGRRTVAGGGAGRARPPPPLPGGAARGADPGDPVPATGGRLPRLAGLPRARPWRRSERRVPCPRPGGAQPWAELRASGRRPRPAEHGHQPADPGRSRRPDGQRPRRSANVGAERHTPNPPIATGTHTTGRPGSMPTTAVRAAEVSRVAPGSPLSRRLAAAGTAPGGTLSAGGQPAVQLLPLGLQQGRFVSCRVAGCGAGGRLRCSAKD